MKLVRNIPNIITVCRIALVPLVIVSLIHAHFSDAFVLFLIAGVSDALDGLLARRFQWTSRFGSIIDPLADKLLLVSCFITLTWLQQLPIWLLIAVIARDVLISVGVCILPSLIGRYDFQPSIMSKVNTFLQILLVSLAIFQLAFAELPSLVIPLLIPLVFFTTAVSLLAYLWVWGKRAFGNKHE